MAITIDQIDQMWEAYQEEQTAVYVSKTCSVGRRTATKYIKEGDSERGIESLESRFKNLQVEAQKQSDKSHASRRAEVLTMAKAARSVMAKNLKKILEKGPEAKFSVNDFRVLSEMELVLSKEEEDSNVEVAAGSQLQQEQSPAYNPDLVKEFAHMILQDQLNHPEQYDNDNNWIGDKLQIQSPQESQVVDAEFVASL